jgi:hypothetical protein
MVCGRSKHILLSRRGRKAREIPAMGDIFLLTFPFIERRYRTLIPHTLQAWPLQRRSAVAFIFEDPLFGDFQIVAFGELDQ